MWEPQFGDRVTAWPVGIDTDRWAPKLDAAKDIDVLIYNKIRWDHERMERTLVSPIRDRLKALSVSFLEIRYGSYQEEEFLALLGRCRAMIFICEHETQGIAYQQALSVGVPILAWDRGGYWQDPAFYPHKVKFEPVTSVPYWDPRCGQRFASLDEFPERLDAFLNACRRDAFSPRDFILENLTLDGCARAYVRICEVVMGTSRG